MKIKGKNTQRLHSAPTQSSDQLRGLVDPEEVLKRHFCLSSLDLARAALTCV